MKKLIFLSVFFFLIPFFSLFSQSALDSMLFEAVKSNNIEKVKAFVEQGANVNAVDKDGGTVLMWAAYKSDLDMVKYLVEKGADYKKKGTISISDGNYGNLLGISAGEKKLNMLKYFIEECKIDINDREYDTQLKADSGWTALEWASSNGYNNIIYYLLSKGANASLETYLRYALEDFFINKISENPKLIYGKNEKGENLLFRAIYRNANKVVKRILETDIDINEMDNEGNTPLIKSIFWNNKEAAMMLIDKGADVNSKSTDGTTAYLQAKRRGYEDVMSLLVKNGAEVSSSDGMKPELIVQMGHGVTIACLDFSSDGKYLISGGEDGMILWEMKTGKELKKYNIFNVSYVKFLYNDKFVLYK